tara:strand:- start:389 stop:505 length:117 start_codon:yes stop_codon:yes gene_type:complete
MVVEEEKDMEHHLIMAYQVVLVVVFIMKVVDLHQLVHL